MARSKTVSKKVSKKEKVARVAKSKAKASKKVRVSGDIINKMSTDIEGDNNAVDVDDVYRMSDLMFKDFPWQYRHLHNSYNTFINDTLPNFFTQNEHVFHEIATDTQIVRHKFVFSNIVIVPPKKANSRDPMLPSDARKRQKSYQLNIYADITQVREVIDATSSGRSKVTSSVAGHATTGYHVCTVPVMIKSQWCNDHIHQDTDSHECAYDPGGYFIINGSEKIVICQDRMLSDYPLVFTRKITTKVFNVVQVNSKSKKLGDIMQTVTIKMKNDGNMVLKFPVLYEINPIILFKALGVVAEGEIIEYCVGDKNDVLMVNLLKKSIRNCVNDNYDSNIPINTQDEAIDYLITKMRVIRSISDHYSQTDQAKKLEQKRMSLMELLKTSFLPHITGDSPVPYREKAMYLGFMINRLLQVELKRRPVDDRDSYTNKRVDNINELLFEIFIQKYKAVMNDCKKAYKSWMKDKDVLDDPYNTIHNIKAQDFESGFKAALMQGTWPRAKGVSQMLQRLSYMQLLTFLSRIDSPSGTTSSGKLTKPRQVHYSGVPFLDSAQTPEHAKVGLIKHLSLVGSLTIGDRVNTTLVREYIQSHPNVHRLSHIKSHELKYMYKVFINGEWIGVIRNVYPDNPVVKFYSEAKMKKISGEFSAEMTSVVLDVDNREIRFNTDSGRLYRPVFRVVGDNQLVVTKEMISKIDINKNSWEDFYSQKPYPIEFIDSEEQPYSMLAYDFNVLNEVRDKILNSRDFKFDGIESEIANRYGERTFVRYDYCELHPSLLLGEIICNVPFAERNPGTRNMFQYAQGKQGMCIYSTVYRSRTDKSFILYRPEVPVTSTRTSKYTYTDILPPGQNAMVAIATYSGYNQEDSLIFNGNSIDNGFMWSMSLTKVVSEISKNQETTASDKFGKPSPENTHGIQRANYGTINKEGYAVEETVLNNDDVIFGKMTPVDIPDSNIMYKDSSEIYANNIGGVVDRVYTNIENNDGNEMRKALIRSERIPKPGDKFCIPDCVDVDVMTTEGWIPLKNITLKHKVATLTNNGILSYEHPTNIVVEQYDGDIYKLRSQQIDMDVTKNHMLYVKKRDKTIYERVEAHKMYGKRYRMKKNCINNFDDLDAVVIDYKQYDYDIDALIQLIGIFIADGCLRSNNTVQLAGEKQRKIEFIREVGSKLNITIKSEKNKNTKLNNLGLGCSHCFKSKPLYNFLLPLNKGALNKRLPDYVFKLSQRQARVLMDALVRCDGSINNTNSMCYYTSSSGLADDVMRLAIHCGWAASIKIIRKKGSKWNINGRTGVINADCLSVRITKAKCEPQINHGHKNTQNGQSEEIYHYTGTIRCIEVPNHVFMMRQNNKNVWTGNCSRFGQKGTIGIILSQEDMPHNRHGISPDIIMNPQAFPSRMTIGQLNEMLSSKVGGLKGMFMDGTSFTGIDITDVEDMLEKLGYHRSGEEYMYNGMTGNMMKTRVFFAPAFYQRLKHLVDDKMHSRAEGRTTILTRQAAEGRARKGGLRLGEMERDALVAHGVSMFLQEKHMFGSDIYATFVCGECGVFANRKPQITSTNMPTKDDIFYCPLCRKYGDIHKIVIPYAFKLMIQELQAMSIMTKIKLKKTEPRIGA
jgi:DNA-directed RNA polymerase II subunit RPB2